jgi:TRAP-type C4-dicarboxylate transport system permease small subunit
MVPLARLVGGLAIGAAAVLTAVFTAAVVWTVVSRYGFGRTPVWAEELPRLLLVWAAFLGAGGAEARGGHLSAGLLALVLGEGRAGRVAAALGDVAVIGFSALAVWATVEFVAIAGGGTTTALALPASAFYWAAAAGAALIAFGATARLLSRL